MNGQRPHFCMFSRSWRFGQSLIAYEKGHAKVHGIRTYIIYIHFFQYMIIYAYIYIYISSLLYDDNFPFGPCQLSY